MLVFETQNLVFLAVPKTGTSAIEAALKHHASPAPIKVGKHINARQYLKRVAPQLAQPQTFAVMREPVDQLRSWYKYRSRPALNGKPESTAHLTFDQFVRDVLETDPKPHAHIGSQHRFLTDKNGALAVDHLFQYEDQARFLIFLQKHFGEDTALKPVNVSPQIEAPLSPDVKAELHTARASEFALYLQLEKAGGYLAQDGQNPLP